MKKDVGGGFNSATHPFFHRKLDNCLHIVFVDGLMSVFERQGDKFVK